MQEREMSGESQVMLRRAVIWVAALNFGYFFAEFAVARHIGSVSLFADSIDFLEDTIVNALILVALGWSQRSRATLGIFLALVLLLPGLATALMAWHKFMLPTPPSPLPLSMTGLGALAINIFCAFLLARVRHVAGSLSRAAFLSARNDAYANIAIMVAGGVTFMWASAWPDLVVGLGIFAMNLDAAREVYGAARREQASMEART